MFEEQLLRVGGIKLLGGTLLSIGSISVFVVSGVIVWKMWNKSQNSPQKRETVEASEKEASAPVEKIDVVAQASYADLQAEIDALNAEKQKLAEQVRELKTTPSNYIPPAYTLDESFPKTNLKLGMLQQLIRDNLELRNATV